MGVDPLTAGLGIGGAALGFFGSREQSRALEDAAGRATTELSPFNIFTPGGGFAGFGDFTVPRFVGDVPGAATGPIRGGGFIDLPFTPGGGRFRNPGAGVRVPGIRDLPSGFLTAAGLPAGFNPANIDGQNIGIGLGDVEPARSGLVNLANLGIAQAGAGGLPSNVAGADLLVRQALGIAPDQALSGLSTLESGVGEVLGASQRGFGDLLSQGFRRGFSGEAFDAARQQFGDAGITGQQATDTALAALRARALPENERAVAGTLDRLFAGGQLGTTGGANILGRLAESQNQQDLGFQLAALEEGRRARESSLGLARGFSDIGTGTTALGESLLQGAFGRFATTAGLGADLNTQRFQRSLLGTQFGTDLLQRNFQNQITLAGLPQSLRAGDLNFALQALTGQGALQSQGLDSFGAALAAAQAQANARIGAGSNLAAFAENPNFGASPFTGIGDALTAFAAAREGK
jgi:hypothetical protein